MNGINAISMSDTNINRLNFIGTVSSQGEAVGVQKKAGDTVEISDIAKSLLEASQAIDEQRAEREEAAAAQAEEDAKKAASKINYSDPVEYQKFLDREVAKLAQHLNIEDPEMLKAATTKDVTEYIQLFEKEYSSVKPKVKDGIETPEDFWKAKFETDADGNFVKDARGQYIHKDDSDVIDPSVWVNIDTGVETRFTFTDEEGNRMKTLSLSAGKTIGETNAGALMLLNRGLETDNEEMVDFGLQAVNGTKKYEEFAVKSDTYYNAVNDFITNHLGWLSGPEHVFKGMFRGEDSTDLNDYTFFNKYITLLEKKN